MGKGIAAHLGFQPHEPLMGLPGRVQNVALLAQVHELRAQGNDLALLGDGRLSIPKIPSGRIRRDLEHCDMIWIDDRDHESAVVDRGRVR